MGEPIGEPVGEPVVNEGEPRPPRARGKKRMAQLSKASESDRLELERAILAEVGEAPSALHRIAAEALSSAVVGARRKRAAGHSDAEALRMVAQLARAFNLKPPPPAPAEEPNPFAMLLDDDTDEAAE